MRTHTQKTTNLTVQITSAPATTPPIENACKHARAEDEFKKKRNVIRSIITSVQGRMVCFEKSSYRTNGYCVFAHSGKLFKPSLESNLRVSFVLSLEARSRDLSDNTGSGGCDSVSSLGATS